MWKSNWMVLIAAVFVTGIAVLATTIYLHRALAHRSLAFHWVADFIFRVILWLTTGQEPRAWVAVHRKHHAFTDIEGDPHSPIRLGYWKVQILNFWYYAKEARNPETIRKFAPDIVEDRWDRAVFSRGFIGLGVGIALLCLLLGPWRGAAAAVAHLFLYVFVLAPLINALGHRWGYRNFENTAYNSRVLAWFTGGESLHNNHHAYPRAPKFSIGRFEFDPAWLLILAMSRLRLLKITGEIAKSLST
ncbi:MAG: hypothetical protein A3H71_00210 [Candidatus Sungbacteria bacterium RIFCSPLOWO2_02_FULL_48_13b]|uniref:Fatty acid desaturase domain-containing protein n=1 Tax=Candidatus Sungbacteria bacterium RIFCSPLOWO2_02_FULL_48_13b TaxID=1802283 RepID=A0A1G2LES5_9BACT|nr:MAG: hypothetical protein A3H71_00210 [Candidatus Sungbacteria bacterium RIFCSPLOWO2_02_FULL_48_13b]